MIIIIKGGAPCSHVIMFELVGFILTKHSNDKCRAIVTLLLYEIKHYTRLRVMIIIMWHRYS